MRDDLATQIAQQIATKMERHTDQESYDKYVGTVAGIIRDRILNLQRETPEEKQLWRAAKKASKMLKLFISGKTVYPKDVSDLLEQLDKAIGAYEFVRIEKPRTRAASTPERHDQAKGEVANG